MIPTNISAEQVQVFLLVFVRVLSMIALLPFLGSQSVPMQLKAGFSFLIAIILFPAVAIGGLQASTLAGFIFLVVQEVFIGITIGFVASLLFVAVQFAGRLIDSQMGFALVQLVDPFNDTEATVAGQFQVLIFSIVFLLMNGHYFFLLAIQKSFELIPMFQVRMPSAEVTQYIGTMVANIFIISLRLAAPVFAVLTITELALGIVARTVPQLNVFFVGMPLKIGLGVGSLAIALPVLASLFRTIAANLINDIWQLLYLMA